MNSDWKYSIRVYGIFINAENEILLSDEFQLGLKMTKFPGGGMHFGEGATDCLRREIREECNGQEIKDINHYYTTDFYQKALFFENCQLISIYFKATFILPVVFPVADKPFAFGTFENGKQSFRWVKIETLDIDQISFPIDKFVAEKIKKEFENS